MFRHYIKIAFRNLARQKVFALINIAGLTIGLTCFILFSLYAVNEFSYDRFHLQAGDIYRVYDWWDYKGEKPRQGNEATSVTPLGPAMKQDMPEVEDYVRVKGPGSKMVRVDDKIQSAGLSYVDPAFLKVFTFPLIYGNPATALNDQHHIVLTKDKAKELFGEINAVGRTLEIKFGDEYKAFTVTGITESVPVNSSIHFDMLTSFAAVLATEEGIASMNNWHMTIGIQVFVKLRKGSAVPADRLASFYAKYKADEKEMMIEQGDWDGKGAWPAGYGLQPLRDIHTNTAIDYGAVSRRNIWILVGIAAGVLLIACINFTTLAIGRSAGRAREIGVRKVMGGHRKQLITQFVVESFLLTLFSAGLGLLLAYVLLPFFNQLAGTKLLFSFELYPEMIMLLAVLVLTVGLLSGSYPALVLSRFKAVEVLKNKMRLAGANIFTRSLVTFQFVLSIGLIIVTIIILRQLSFMHGKNLGFARENVVMINASGNDTKKLYALFRQDIQANPAIAGITSGSGLGAYEGQMGGGYEVNGKREGVIEYPIDQDYLKVMGMQLIAGRNFNPAITSDTVNSVIVNEALVSKFFGVTPAEAIGKEIKRGKANETRTIIGVTRNFNFEDLKREVRPQLFSQPAEFHPSRFFVRIAPGDPSKVLAAMESSWRKLMPDVPFTYHFVDDKFNRFYESEKRWSSIVGWAGGISIFLACLGLFGLAALAAVNRTKEIGIRRILGASLSGIIGLLGKEFIKLVIIALVIASPLAWYFMNEWLQDYAYRIQIGWGVFLLTGIAVSFVALLIIGIQAVKAGLINPGKSLKAE